MERHPHSWNGRFNIVKIAILPKVIYRFNVTFIKIPIVVFTEIDKNNSKIHLELQKKIRIAKAILRKNNKAERITLLEFKIS